MSATYVIAELKEGEQGGFEPRGAAVDFWRYRGSEVVIAGPAETGKTWAACQKADALLWKYAGAQGVMARSTYAALTPSALQTYKRIIGYPDTPIKFYGGEMPRWADYPNGSRLWIVGLDNPGKVLSSERDFFYINQAEEIELEAWETILTRCTGRGAVMPYTQVFADCNPGPPTHWIINRNGLKVLHSRHEDNPTLFEADGTITAQGVRTMAILDSLTGVRYQRLRLGKWVQAEGAVYEQFQRAVHVRPKSWLVERGVFLSDGVTLNRDKIKRVVSGQDWGYTNPGVLLVVAIDGDGVNYVIHEVYRSKRLIEWWCDQFVSLVRRFGISEMDCDPAEPAFIEAYQRALAKERLTCRVVGGINDILPGIDAVQKGLQLDGRGECHLYFYEGMLAEQDAELIEQKLPTSSLQEVDLYVWPKGVDGKVLKEKPVDAFNHGMDTLRYLRMRQVGKRGIDFA